MILTDPSFGFLTISILLFLAVLASKTSGRLGVPALVFFMVLGFIFGPTVLDVIRVDNFFTLERICSIALAVILFSGGLDTNLSQVRPVLLRASLLATVGVLLTAVVIAVIAYFTIGCTVAEAFLLGSIVSSTDAAAVFSVLRSRSIGLKHRLKPLLEFESGSNDPMALMLTKASILWVIGEQANPWLITGNVLMQLVFGAGTGILVGWLALKVINRISLQYEGLFSVLILSVALFTQAMTEMVNGNSLLAAYCVGIVLGNKPFMHKQSAMKFFDGLAWIMQIVIFIALSLLVDLNVAYEYLVPGLILAFGTIFLARTIGVFATLLPFRKVSLAEKTFISWVGLKGAAPLVFAILPFLAISKGMDPKIAEQILYLVYYIVFASVILQGSSLSLVAKWLNLDLPMPAKTFYPIEMEERQNFQSLLQEIVLPEECDGIGPRLMELNLPTDSLILLIHRGDQFVMPNGSTRLKPHDKLLVLATTASDLESVYHRLGVEVPETT